MDKAKEAAVAIGRRASGGLTADESLTLTQMQNESFAADAAARRGTVGAAEAAKKMDKTMRIKVGKFIESRKVDMAILFLVMIYMCIVFAQVVLEDRERTSDFETPPDVNNFLQYCDFIILILFGIEISCKFYAFRWKYLGTCVNFFDALVVVTSLAMLCIEMFGDATDGVERFGRVRAILRLLRIVIIFRKLSNVSDTVRYMAVKYSGLGYNLEAPVDQVIAALENVQGMGTLTKERRKEVNYALRVVRSGKLYEPVIEEEELKDPNNQRSDEANAWLKNATNAQGINRRRRGGGNHFIFSNQFRVLEP